MTREKRLLQIRKQLSKITTFGVGWSLYSDEGSIMNIKAGKGSTLYSVCMDKGSGHICIAGVMGRTEKEAFNNAKFIGDAPKTIKYLLGLVKSIKHDWSNDIIKGSK